MSSTPMSNTSSGEQLKTARDLAVENYVRPVVSNARRNFMLALFCTAQFIDVFLSSCLFPAIPTLQTSLDMDSSEIAWILAAYSATFAAFMLISGRISDVYSSKWTFIAGALVIGAFSLGSGFTSAKITFFLLRAFAGIGAALTIPSGLSLIIEWFPDPEEQAVAVALFGGSGGIGNVLGVIVGGIFIQWATWRWILYLTGIVGLAIAVLAVVAVPPSAPRREIPSLARLDPGGVFLITSSIIIFVYAITSGPIDGWGSANTVAPLVVSIALAVAFFLYEKYIPEDIAALPPKAWRYPNIPIIVAVALVPFGWWAILFVQLMPLYQQVYGWNAIMSAVRFIPNSVPGTIAAGFASTLVKWGSPKWSIAGALLLQFIGTIILPFANTRDKYWSHDFPAFFIGSVGSMIMFTTSSIALFMNTPPEISGVAGAMYNSALQLGTALGVAVVTSIQTSMDKKRIRKGEEPGYHGIADGFWFVVALDIFMFFMVMYFYKVEPKKTVSDAEGSTTGSDDGSATDVSATGAPIKEKS